MEEAAEASAEHSASVFATRNMLSGAAGLASFSAAHVFDLCCHIPSASAVDTACLLGLSSALRGWLVLRYLALTTPQLSHKLQVEGAHVAVCGDITTGLHASAKPNLSLPAVRACPSCACAGGLCHAAFTEAQARIALLSGQESMSELIRTHSVRASPPWKVSRSVSGTLDAGLQSRPFTSCSPGHAGRF